MPENGFNGHLVLVGYFPNDRSGFQLRSVRLGKMFIPQAFDTAQKQATTTLPLPAFLLRFPALRLPAKLRQLFRLAPLTGSLDKFRVIATVLAELFFSLD